MKKKIIAFAWWWTWGHIFPIKALIETLNKDNYTILWFGEKWKLEEKVAMELKDMWFDIKFLPISAWKIRRQLDIKSVFKNIADLFKNLLGFFQSLYYICKYKPDFVFSKWGFVAFNPSLAGKICWKKIYLHESDTVPGLVNKLVWKFADRVFLWFLQAKKYFDKDKVLVVGQLLTDKLLDFKDNWKEWKTNLLLVWGSQWAKILISTIKKLLDKWFLKSFNIFVVWWLLNNKNIFENYENVYFYDFIPQKNLFSLYKKADLSITRGSATSLAEQDYFNIKKIIVPLPFTGWNHQYFNGLAYKKKWDYLLSQQDKDFENQLLNLLEKLENYKKGFVLKKEVLEWKNNLLKAIWIK